MQLEFLVAGGEVVGAKAVVPVRASPKDVIAKATALSKQREMSHLLRGIPMIKSLSLDGDRAAIQMQFKVAFLSVNFGVKGRVTRESERVVHFQSSEGEPRDTHLRFELKDNAVELTISFDLDSLGFVAKYFLKHHPEIRPGIFAGVAYSVGDSIQRQLNG